MRRLGAWLVAAARDPVGLAGFYLAAAAAAFLYVFFGGLMHALVLHRPFDGGALSWLVFLGWPLFAILGLAVLTLLAAVGVAVVAAVDFAWRRLRR